MLASSSKSFSIEFQIENNKDYNGIGASSSNAFSIEFLIEINKDSNECGLPHPKHVLLNF
jgi:hypothetical protein